MSDLIIDKNISNKSLRIASIEKRSKFHKRFNLLRKRNALNLDDMLDIVNLVNIGLKGEKLPKISNPKVTSYAVKIIKLNKNAKTKDRADLIIKELNHRIIKKNRRESNLREGKRLYKELMKGL